MDAGALCKRIAIKIINPNPDYESLCSLTTKQLSLIMDLLLRNKEAPNARPSEIECKTNPVVETITPA